MKGIQRVLLAVGVVIAATALAGMSSESARAAGTQEWQVGFSFNCNNNTFCGGQTGGFWG